MSRVLTDPSFRFRSPTFSESLFPGASQPSSQNPSAPWSIPKGRGNKEVGRMTNDTSVAYVRGVPFEARWEENYSTGMPIFTNSKKAILGSPSVLVATPAVVNYYLEEGARILKNAALTKSKRVREDMVMLYQAKDFLCPTTISEFANTWRFYGVLASIGGKGSEGGFPGGPTYVDERIFNCNVLKFSKMLNYWGNVSDGDRVGFTVGMKRNPHAHFYDPSGQIVGDSLASPEYFPQIVPVSFGKNGHAPAHNRNFVDPEDPMRDDIDFMYRNFEIPQTNLFIDASQGISQEREIDLSREVSKFRSITTDFYDFGIFIPVGIVKSSPRDAIPRHHDLELAMRSDRKAQTLGSIEVFLGC